MRNTKIASLIVPLCLTVFAILTAGSLNPAFGAPKKRYFLLHRVRVFDDATKEFVPYGTSPLGTEPVPMEEIRNRMAKVLYSFYIQNDDDYYIINKEKDIALNAYKILEENFGDPDISTALEDPFVKQYKLQYFVISDYGVIVPLKILEKILRQPQTNLSQALENIENISRINDQYALAAKYLTIQVLSDIKLNRMKFADEVLAEMIARYKGEFYNKYMMGDLFENLVRRSSMIDHGTVVLFPKTAVEIAKKLLETKDNLYKRPSLQFRDTAFAQIFSASSLKANYSAWLKLQKIYPPLYPYSIVMMARRDRLFDDDIKLIKRLIRRNPEGKKLFFITREFSEKDLERIGIMSDAESVLAHCKKTIKKLE